MIKLQKYTPEIYSARSRDFQLLCQLFDVELNYVKTNADIVNNLFTNAQSSSQLIDLLTMTLGFKSKHNYNLKQLTALCSVLPYILRKKGSILAVKLACNTILTAESATQEVEVFVNGATLEIIIPKEISDTNLLKDLLDYILPAGMSCVITRNTTADLPAATIENKFKVAWERKNIDAVETAQVYKTGLEHEKQAGKIDMISVPRIKTTTEGADTNGTN